MVWIYDNPPYTSREVRAYAFLRKKLKDKKFVDSLFKLLSLTVYLKTHKFKTVKEIQKSAYYDKAQTRPIFDEKTAKLILKGTTQKGGVDVKTILESKYPYLNVMLRGITLDYSPKILMETIGRLYIILTEAFDTIKKFPGVDIGLDIMHALAETSVTVANDVGSEVAGISGAVAVAPFTAVVAGLASIIATAEGDIGGAVAHVVNWIPALGIMLNKAMLEMEHFATKLEGHKNIAAWIPYMTEFIDTKATKKLKVRPDPTSEGDSSSPSKTVASLPQSAPSNLVEPSKSSSAPPPKPVASSNLASLEEDPQAPAAAAGGKRLSTRKRKGRKWPKTMRRRKSAMY